MSNLSVTGVIKEVLKPESGTSNSGKEWNKQEFVIETEDQYPKLVCFTLFGDKVNKLDGLGEGSKVEVHFNIESREYNGKYFHNVNAWKIDGFGENTASQEQAPPHTKEDEPPF